MLRRLVFALILLLGIGPALAQSFARADRELRAAEREFRRANEWVVPEDTPRNRALMKREWRAQQDWASAYLALHPKSSHAQLRHPEFGKNDIPIEFEFAGLGHGAVLVATRDAEIGTVFVLAPRNRGLATIWSVTDVRPPAGLVRGNRLHDWSADCSVRYPKEILCRPLSGSIGILPAKPDGTARFYIDATYAQDAGATAGNQVTIWDWDGSKATPRYLKVYSIMVEQPDGLRQKGDTIVLRMKDDWAHFFSCGACNGRQRDLTLQLTATGVRERGVRSIHPELDRIGLLIDRIFAGKPAGDIASPQAITMIRAQASDNIEQMKDPKQANTAPVLGMVSNYRITHRKQATKVCLELDALADQFNLIGGRIVEVKPVTSGSCGGPGSES